MRLAFWKKGPPLGPKPTLIGGTLLLGLLSAALYALHLALFDDPRDAAFYTLLDMAFLPLQVMLVGLVLNRLLVEREKRALLHKLNMVIGAFYSEVGLELLQRLAASDVTSEQTRSHLGFDHAWTADSFSKASQRMARHDPKLDARLADLASVRSFLLEKRTFLLRLLENPTLLEHEHFSRLLWAVFHALEELSARPSFDDLPEADIEHLSGDLRRAYTLLLEIWLQYLGHLHRSYPYLYSLAVRTNPFNPEARVVFGERAA
jgi:hypothetical protein